MPRLIIAAAVLLLVSAAASLARRRRRVDPPSQGETWEVPRQLDRRDFAEPSAPWLVVVFSSATCDACASMVAKAVVLRSTEVAVQEAEYTGHRELHARYSIGAVPTTVVADSAGVVRASFVGPVSATDLWAAVAGARDPSVRPEPCQGHGRREGVGHDVPHIDPGSR